MLRTATHPAADRLLRARAAGRHLILLFDFDGTLAPYADEPHLARLPADARRLLGQVARLPGVFLGFVSGRTAADLRESVGLPGVYYAGTSGLELDMLGVRVTHPDAPKARELIDRVQPGLHGLCFGYPGTWVQRKPLALTLHYRHLVGVLVDGFRETVRIALSPYQGRVTVTEGAKAFEVVPNLGWTKGTAVRAIVEDAARNGFPFYAGDESNDADALAAAVRLGGVAVGVGPRAPAAAQYRLPDPPALVELLAELLDRCRSADALAAWAARTAHEPEGLP